VCGRRLRETRAVAGWAQDRPLDPAANPGYTQIGDTLRITMVEPLPEDAQTLLAELLALLLAQERERS
jgi:hypothetical protein